MDQSITTKKYLEMIGLYSTRVEEKQLFTIEFSSVAGGSINNELSLEYFKAHCLARNFTTPKAADVAFHVFDRDNNGAIDRYEYALFRCVITHFVPERDNNSVIMDLRLIIAYKMYDFDNNDKLTYPEIYAMVRDMAVGDKHVLALMNQMEFTKENASLTLAEFFSPAIRSKFALLYLSTASMLAPKPPTLDRSNVALQLVLSDTNVISNPVNFAPTREKSIMPNVEVYNTGMEIEMRKKSVISYRGLLVDKNHQAFSFASNIIENARKMSLKTYAEDDISDNLWKLENEALFEMTNCTSLNQIYMNLLELNKECKRIVSSQPTRVNVPNPAKIFGDIHGQFRDLLLLFREFCFPSSTGGDIETVSYVFNGDFVDRGMHQIEVVTLLFALKVAFPARIFLLRGNHEFRELNQYMSSSQNHGFDSQCSARFGDAVGPKYFESVHDVFDWLPLMAVVSKCILVIHGGIGRGNWHISDVDAVIRPMTTDTQFGDEVRNLFWSDPDESDERMQRGVHTNPARGTGILRFSRDITKKFCERNSLQMIVRSHQNPTAGYKVMHDGLLITVFSARNYFDHNSNDGAIILVIEGEDGKTLVRCKQLVHRSLR